MNLTKENIKYNINNLDYIEIIKLLEGEEIKKENDNSIMIGKFSHWKKITAGLGWDTKETRLDCEKQIIGFLLKAKLVSKVEVEKLTG